MKSLLANYLPCKGHRVVYEVMKKSEDLEDNQGLLFTTFNLHPTAIIAAISETFIIIRGAFSKADGKFLPFCLRGV